MTMADENGAGGGGDPIVKDAPLVAPEAATPTPDAIVPGKTLLGDAVAKAASDAQAAKTASDAAAAEYKNDDTKTPEENAALKAAHDAAKAKEPAKADEKAKVDDKPIDPANYTFQPPEGFELDPAIDTEFRGIAAELKLDQGAVDKLTGLQIKLYEKQAEAVAAQVTKWGDETKKDKELGGADHDAKMAKAAGFISTFFSPTVAGLLNKTGLGNHPEFVRGMYRAGLAMGELSTPRGGPGGSGGKESISEILYPTK